MRTNKNRNSSEEELFIRYIETRDEKSFNALFKRIDSWLFVLVYSLVGNRSIANDIIQETWVKVIENADRFDPQKGKFSNYIYTVAKNIALQNIKRTNRHKEILKDYSQDYINPELQDEINELGKLIRQTIKGFKHKGHQDTILLYYFAGFDAKEIANQLDTKEHNILNWLKRGRKQLETELKKHPEFDSIYETVTKIIYIALITWSL